MIRLLCALSVAGLITAGSTAQAAKPKGDKVELLFKKLDTNNDGSLSKEEFAKITTLVHKKAGETKGKGKHADKLFDKLDADNDGKLSLDEFRKLKELRKQKKDE
jgi:Ca2+-binding EF-hand superfamily protein